MGSSILGVKNKMMSQDGSRAMFHVLALLLQKNLPQAPSFTKNDALRKSWKIPRARNT